MKILFKYPTKGRPEWFKSTLEKYYQLLSGENECRFIISMDTDDMTMNNGQIWNYLNDKPNLTYFYGSHANKVQACNDNMDYDFDILVLVSDDMIPQAKGFDKIISDDMKNYFPGLDGALHYPDGRVGSALMTQLIMGINLYRKLGYIYYPAYHSQWCDNEAMEVAQKLNKYIFIDNLIVVHEWKRNGTDEVYNVSDGQYINDKKIYEWRKERGFPYTFSQRDEDTVIRKHFENVFDGNFLDIGAGDGFTFSNTKILYDNGWSGVYIEPSPSLFPVLKELSNPDRVKLIKKALSDKSGQIGMYHAPKDFVSTTVESHRKKWQSAVNFEHISVDTITWAEIEAMGKFDFINLDIEGNSVDMLLKMPESMLNRVKMLCVEYDDKKDLVKHYLNRYKLRPVYESAENLIFVKSGESVKPEIIQVSGHSIYDITKYDGNGYILDIGSRNYGFTNYFASKGFNCVCVEPDDDVKFSEHEKVTLIRAAVVGPDRAGQEDTLIKWSTGEGNHLKSLPGDVPSGSKQQTVKCISIDSIKPKIVWDIVKLDCEGAEYEILLSWPGPIAKQITVEYHDIYRKEEDAKRLHEKINNHLLKWYRIVKFEPTTLGGCNRLNYWDSLYVLKNEF